MNRKTLHNGRRAHAARASVLAAGMAIAVALTGCSNSSTPPTNGERATQEATASAGSPVPSAPSGEIVTQQPGTPVLEGLSSPVGMAFDAEGNLYIANWSGGTIERLGTDGTRSTFADGLSGPSGLAISPEGDIYAASYSGDVVWRFAEDGTPTVFVTGLATPAGLSFNSAGELLIANRRTNEILAADSNGATRVVAGGFQTPVGAVEIENGDLIVSNINGGISLVTGSSEVTELSSALASPGPGIALAGADAAYVVDYGGTTVHRIASDGTLTLVADGFRSPTSIAVAPDGRVAVADWGTNALYLIDPSPPVRW